MLGTSTTTFRPVVRRRSRLPTRVSARAPSPEDPWASAEMARRLRRWAVRPCFEPRDTGLEFGEGFSQRSERTKTVILLRPWALIHGFQHLVPRVRQVFPVHELYIGREPDPPSLERGNWYRATGRRPPTRTLAARGNRATGKAPALRRRQPDVLPRRPLEQPPAAEAMPWKDRDLRACVRCRNCPPPDRPRLCPINAPRSSRRYGQSQQQGYRPNSRRLSLCRGRWVHHPDGRLQKEPLVPLAVDLDRHQRARHRRRSRSRDISAHCSHSATVPATRIDSGPPSLSRLRAARASSATGRGVCRPADARRCSSRSGSAGSGA